MDRLKGVTSAYVESCAAIGVIIPEQIRNGLFDVQAASYLGRDEIGIPMSRDEREKVRSIYDRLARYVRKLERIPCYGQRAALVATPDEGDPISATPLLDAMLEVMDDDGHDTSLVRAEVEALKTRIAYLTTHLRAAKYQNDSAIAGIAATLPRSAKPALPPF